MSISVPDIIEAVKTKPELWDSRHPERANRALNKKLWSDTAAALSLGEEELKARWKHLKDHYRKEVRRPKSAWRHFPLLGFLKEEVTVGQRRTKKRIVEEDDDDSKADEDDQFLVISEPDTNVSGSRNRLFEDIISGVGTDEDFHYFMSILPMMRKLSVAQRLHLRSKINRFLLLQLRQNSKRKS